MANLDLMPRQRRSLCLRMLAVRFRLSLRSLHNRLFATLASDPSANHLINSYGLPPESAATICTKLKLNRRKLANSDSVVHVLKDYGFSNTQIVKIILKRPSTLASRVSTVKPKLQLFQENGFVGNHLTELIVSNPMLLGKGVACDLQPCLDFLKKVLGNEDKVIAAVRRSTKVLSYALCKNMKPNIDLMVAQGVLPGTISNFIMKQPRTLLLKPERVAYAIGKVNVLGFHPSAPMFIHAVRVVLSMSQENWDRKMECFKSLGWSEEDIASVFRRYPLCLGLSEEKIKVSWDFFVDELKYDRAAVVSNPKVLMYGLETRVIPRLNVFRLLKSMGLVSENMQFSYVLGKTNKDFVKRFLVPNQELVPHLLDIFEAPYSFMKGNNT